MKYLAINRCPKHDFYAISIDDAASGTGIRLTPSKCCGRWETVHRWPLDMRMAREIETELAEVAAK